MIQDLIVSLRSVFSGNSAGDDVGRIIIPLILVVVLVVIFIVVMYALYLRTPRGRVEALLEERAGRGDTSRWPVRLTVALILVVSLGFLTYQMQKPSQCAKCHTEVDYAQTVADSPHDGVNCLACHGQPGVAGPVADVAQYSRWIFVYASSKKAPEPRSGSVSSAACLSCHGAIRNGVVQRNGVRVRHSDFLDTGTGCRECHNSVAHGDAVSSPSTPAMNRCLLCHDGTKASADCDYCHVEDVASSAAKSGNLPKAKNVDTGNCYACHDEKPCKTCHGTTMPHPKGWGPQDGGPGQSGSHPYEGFKDREVCWRCHFAPGKPFVASNESCSCHGLFGKMHGGAAWVEEHWKEATGVTPGAEAECFMCHGQYLCDQCHPASYSAKYNPDTSGNSNYHRDIPYDPDYWEY